MLVSFTNSNDLSLSLPFNLYLSRSYTRFSVLYKIYVRVTCYAYVCAFQDSLFDSHRFSLFHGSEIFVFKFRTSNIVYLVQVIGILKAILTQFKKLLKKKKNGIHRGAWSGSSA